MPNGCLIEPQCLLVSCRKRRTDSQIFGLATFRVYTEIQSRVSSTQFEIFGLPPKTSAGQDCDTIYDQLQFTFCLLSLGFSARLAGLLG